MKPLNDFKNFIHTSLNDQIDEVSNILKDEKWSPLMNHGYKNLNHVPVFNYNEEDHSWSNQLNLYMHLFETSKKFNLDFENLKVLDVGCGFGQGTAAIKKYYNFNQVTGLDYGLDLIKDAELKFKNVTYIHGTATSLPFEDNSFDIIVNVESLHHYKFTHHYYKEAYRVLKPGGYLLMCDAFGPYFEEYVSEMFFEKIGFYLSDKINITPMVAESCKDDIKNFKLKHPYVSNEKIEFYINLFKEKDALYSNYINVFLSYIYYKM